MTKEQAAALTAQNLRIIFAFAMSRVSHRQDAEDLAGEIVVQILESAHRLKNDDAFSDSSAPSRPIRTKSISPAGGSPSPRSWRKRRSAQTGIRRTPSSPGRRSPSCGGSCPFSPGSIGNVRWHII